MFTQNTPKERAVSAAFLLAMDRASWGMTGEGEIPDVVSEFNHPNTQIKEMVRKPIAKVMGCELDKTCLKDFYKAQDEGWKLLINDPTIDLNCIRPILIYYINNVIGLKKCIQTPYKDDEVHCTCERCNINGSDDESETDDD
jgi:hypothetical protein